MEVSDVAKIAGIDLPSGISKSGVIEDNKTAFQDVLDSVMNQVKETDSLQKDAQEAELEYEMGYTDNVHDLAVAQQKANVALQYTVAIRDRLVSAYREIMQMQI